MWALSKTLRTKLLSPAVLIDGQILRGILGMVGSLSDSRDIRAGQPKITADCYLVYLEQGTHPLCNHSCPQRNCDSKHILKQATESKDISCKNTPVKCYHQTATHYSNNKLFLSNACNFHLCSLNLLIWKRMIIKLKCFKVVIIFLPFLIFLFH